MFQHTRSATQSPPYAGAAIRRFSGRCRSFGSRLARRRGKLVFCTVLGACIGGGAAAFAGTAGHTTPAGAYLHRSARAGVLRGKAVAFSGRRITIPVIAVAPGAPSKTFEVHGEINPTLVVPAGTKVRFELANADNGMMHGLDVTRKSPPYAETPALPMQKVAPKTDRKPVSSAARKAIVATGVVRPARDGHWHLKRAAWVTLASGTYYYACPIPSHAKDGMHGRIVVTAPGHDESGQGAQAGSAAASRAEAGASAGGFARTMMLAGPVANRPASAGGS